MRCRWGLSNSRSCSLPVMTPESTGVYGAGGTAFIADTDGNSLGYDPGSMLGQVNCLPKMIRRSRAPSPITLRHGSRNRMGTVRDEWVSEYLMLAYDDIHAIEYFRNPLDAYWKRNGWTFHDMLLAAAVSMKRSCSDAKDLTASL